MAQKVKNPPAMQKTQEMQVQSLNWEDPRRMKWQPTPVFLPEKSPGRRSLAGYSPWCHKKSDTTEGLSTAHKPYPRPTVSEAATGCSSDSNAQ